ncbi:MAG TPA: hypothetical protein VK956_19915, partial [Verrucomicrobium sp.]|nr:hypothetical protein [Verrucomicrobium sp.]
MIPDDNIDDDSFPDEVAASWPSDVSSVTPADWKAALRQELEDWLETVDGMPEPDADDEEAAAEAPSLSSFHEQLTIATSEWKRSGRRTADALTRLGDSLSALGEETRQLRAQRVGEDSSNTLAPDWCMALVETADRLQRLQRAFDNPPPTANSWWPPARAGVAAWKQAWQAQGEAFAILSGHLDGLLRKAALQRVQTRG